MPLNILLVDDHIMITDFYKKALSSLERNTEITVKNTLETAYNFIFNNIVEQPIDVIILDLSMPPYLKKNIFNGDDLARLIRVKYPKIKIIIITSYCEIIRLVNIRQNIYPEGILEKCDIDYNVFLNAFNKIIDGELYRSKTINKSINDTITNNIFLDSLNRQIIHLISQGITTKNIPLHLPITLSTVHKRKSKIKHLLEIDSGNDEDIIRESQKRGII